MVTWQHFKDHLKNAGFLGLLPESIQRIFTEPHGGGNSIYSEALSAVILCNTHRGSHLYSTEMKSRSLYKSTKAKPVDYVLLIPGAKPQLIFVSVFRCFTSKKRGLNYLLKKKIEAMKDINIYKKIIRIPRKKIIHRKVKGRQRGKKRKRIRKHAMRVVEPKIKKLFHIITQKKKAKNRILVTCKDIKAAKKIDIMVDVCPFKSYAFIYTEKRRVRTNSNDEEGELQ